MKKLTSIILSILLACSCMSLTFAVDTHPTISIRSTSGSPYDRVSVQVVISNNPGLVTMLLRVGYDSSVLTLESVTDGSIFGEGNAYFGNDTTADPYVLMWEDGLATENHTANGTLATLTFLVAGDAQLGDTEISVTVDTDSTLDVDLQQVQFNTQSGIITITDTTPNDSAVISVGTMKATAGTQIEVPIRIHNNPGLVAMLLTVSYDASILTLLNAEDGGLFGDGNAYFGNDNADNPYVLMWEDALSQSNHTADGVLATLTFAVSEDAAEGQTAISLLLDEESTFAVDLTAVDIEMRNGLITVEDAEEPQGTPTISIDSVEGTVGNTVQVPIMIQDNPGLIAAQISISYDSSIMALTNVEDGGLFGSNNAYFGNDLTAVPYTFLWEDALASQDHTNDGVLAVLEFEVLQPALEGQTEIHLDYEPSSTFNTNLQDVPFQISSGTVTIRFPGDADEDGEITLQDVVVITRWLAGGWNVTISEINSDVNRDGEINLKDAVLIRRFLAGGWEVTLR